MQQLEVPFLPEPDIEAQAARLLAGYTSLGEEIQLPIPVDAILESHLGLHLGFDDLRASMGKPDVLGALYIDQHEVIIDQSLDPDERPALLGRYRFTLAHEVGHWQLHRPHILVQRRQDDLFGDTSGPSIVCRSSQKKERIEWQADVFAAALLMPLPDVRAQWHRLIGLEPLQATELCNRAKPFMAAGVCRHGNVSIDPKDQKNRLIEAAISPLARIFEVSPQAMRIRLEKLGFIVRDIGTTLSLFEAV